MNWIRAIDLGHWADAVTARVTLPALIADLIRASVSDIGSFRFPSRDAGQIRGFDGRLSARGAPPYIPEGHSIWEFGTDLDYEGKADREYAKRTAVLPAEERVDKKIAHLVERQPIMLPAFNDLDACIDLVERLVLKYERILKRSAPQSLLPTWQYDGRPSSTSRALRESDTSDQR